MAVLVVLVRRIRTKPGASALSNRAVRAVGAGNGYATFAFAIGTVYLSVKFQTWYVWVAFSAAVLALYGVNWMVAAAMSGRQWYRGIAVASFVGTVVLLLSIGTGYEFLIYGLGLLFLVALPGWLMMREEPSEIV
jgi:hypothetical protein